ncbi:O-antigen/teichoic acid export membrane protein [Methanococcus maripaludis]|uniref:O-antigen/teichoic acid export membrane protein n=1 Tax=Methanococcus maripaludis TaxID=39152 RepID=A0A7J9NPK5_METMI|nr:flippase [Methanococcus maripaludis]MBA2846980.1 O-antigen/teichoic acid export membrane protein [Methanococcus maripaludis]
MITKIKNLKNDKGFMTYFKNTSWLFSEKILRIFLGLFVGVWVARYLGPEQYGLFSYAQSFVVLFSALATLGLDGIVVRELVTDESKRDVLLGTSFLLKLIGSIILLSFLAVAVNFTSNDIYTNSLIFIIASATIFQSFNVIDFYFQSKVLSKYVVFSNTISLFISSIIKVILILNNAPLIAFAVVVLFDAVILSFGLIYFYNHKNLSFKTWKFDKNVAVNLLKDSWPLILSGIVITIYMRIDQVMIKEMLGAFEVGQYAAAVTLSEGWYFIPTVICSSLFPAIIYAKKVSEELYYKRLQKLYIMMVWIAIAVALPITWLAEFIVNLIYGSEYILSSNVLKIYVWAGIFVFFGSAWSKWMILENLQKTVIKLQLLSLLTNLVLNYILIPKYGIEGAALSTLISYASGHTFYALLFNNQKIAYKMFWKSLFVRW